MKIIPLPTSREPNRQALQEFIDEMKQACPNFIGAEIEFSSLSGRFMVKTINGIDFTLPGSQYGETYKSGLVEMDIPEREMKGLYQKLRSIEFRDLVFNNFELNGLLSVQASK